MYHDIDHTADGFTTAGEDFIHHQSQPVLDEEEHTSLVSGLMEIDNEEDLGGLLKTAILSVMDAAGKFDPAIARALRKELTSLAKQFLPEAAMPTDAYAGGTAPGRPGSAANRFEMGPEEREWEAANTMIKVATEAAKNATEAPQGGDPHAIAKEAVINATNVHAPHLAAFVRGKLHGATPCECERHHHGRARRSGHWHRRGDQIILSGF